MSSQKANQPVAVIGLACRLPGAPSVAEYWRVIRDGVSTVGKLPEERFDRDLLYDPERGVRNRSYTDIACLIDYTQKSPLWDTLPHEVRDCPEVAYRVIGEVVGEALVNAGVSPDLWGRRRGGGRNAGVYIGHARNSGLSGDLTYSSMVEQTAPLLHRCAEFQRLGAAGDEVVRDVVDRIRRGLPRRGPDGGPLVGANVASSLVSTAFGLNGPSMTFNSACASSLNALMQGVLAVQRNRVDFAVVGGASYCHSDTLVLFSQAQSLSPTGTRPFDASADGLVVGEGCVALVLKRLDRAVADGDRVHAVIAGLGVSSDGKGKSLWAPRVEGQVLAIERAYRSIAPTPPWYLEAHATSTQVGDATEVEALTRAMARFPGQRFAVGSVKANIGHTLETAGLSGLLKAILCLKHRTTPAAINIDQLNPRIDWEASPLRVPTSAEPWPEPPSDRRRRAAVNAFGIGGLNMHVVVDEAAPTASRSTTVATTPPAPTACEPDAIAIVGHGAVGPGALTSAELIDLIASGADPKGPVSSSRWDRDVFLSPGEPRNFRATTDLAGEVRGFEYDWRRHKIPPKQIANASPLQFMILEAVDAALREADLPGDACDRSRVGVVVGTPFGGEFANQLLMGLRLPEFQRVLREQLAARGCPPHSIETIAEQYAEALLEEMPALLDETGSFTSSTLASRITKSFNLMGGGFAVDAGWCGSGAAMMCCEELLASDATDLMICVGAQQDLSIARFEWMGLTGVLGSGRGRSPFDGAADGCLPGEGCGVLLLMRLADARRQGRFIHGIIRGTAASAAGDPKDSSRLAVERALAEASRGSAPISPSDVVRIESVTLGLPEQTRQEFAGLSGAYQSNGLAGKRTVDSLVGQLGHCGAAAGAMAAIKACHELESVKAFGAFGIDETNTSVLDNGLAIHQRDQPLHPVSADGRLATALHVTNETGAAFHAIIERGVKLHVPRRNESPASASTSESLYEEIEGVPHFDATGQRRSKMRDKALQGANRQVTAPATHAPASVNSSVRPAVPAVVVEPAAAAEPAAPTEPVAPVMSASELSEFLVNFVVEQTGYPPEIVELDADLEADLGIDSIKKAQLFGELRQHFDITPDDSLSLDDFPSLQSIADYLQGAAAATPQASATALEPPASVNGSVQPAVAAGPAAAPAPAAPAMSASELSEFLVNFVVEQTGYPPEIVELDADLEADLGIDSIKKAQLFGELRQHFDITPDDSLSLDDFPSLQSIADFIARETGLAQ